MAEDRKERVDRELLNELRIVLPGAQVLFAFLLTLPFTFRFEDLTRAQRDAYFAAFLCTAVGTVLFEKTWAAVVAGLMACWIVVVWYVAPLWQRVTGPEEEAPPVHAATDRVGRVTTARTSPGCGLRSGASHPPSTGCRR